MNNYIPKDGRGVTAGQKVRVYRNLNKPGLFSIMDAKSGLVVGYAPSVTLQDAQFVVRDKARLKVLEKRVRTVHAWCEGLILSTGGDRPDDCSRSGYYSPFQTATFIDEEAKAPIVGSPLVHCQGARAYFA